MSRRALFILLGILAALGLAAFLGTLGQRFDTGPGGPLLPGLKARLNDLDRVVVRTAGNVTVATLVRDETGWTVAEKGYPADLGRLRRNLVALGDATLVEEKTSNPALYSRLGVEDISDPGARGVELELAGGATGDAPESLRLIVGDTGLSGGRFAYVRRSGEATSWLVEADLDLARSAAEWLDRQILDLPAERVRAVTITHPDGAVLRLRKETPEQPSYTVLDVPAGRSLNYEGVADGIGAVLTALNLENVEPREALGDAPGKPVVARFETFDGLQVEVSAWRLAEGTRLTFLASAPGDADGEAKAAAEAEALNARLGGWVYTVASYKAEQLTRRIQDLTS